MFLSSRTPPPPPPTQLTKLIKPLENKPRAPATLTDMVRVQRSPACHRICVWPQGRRQHYTSTTGQARIRARRSSFPNKQPHDTRMAAGHTEQVNANDKGTHLPWAGCPGERAQGHCEAGPPTRRRARGSTSLFCPV